MNLAGVVVLLYLAISAFSAELQIHPGAAFQVLGNQDEEWRFEAATNLSSWSDAPELGTMFSNARPKPLTNRSAIFAFYRGVQTTGLFDDHAFRTFHLTFAMTNWQTLLDRARTSGSNVLCTLSLDNGLTNIGVGARYKGNSSYQLGGLKKSLNIELDHLYSDARLMGHKTINLNNAAADETIMREPIYFTVMNEYAPSPKAAMARLFINGAYWGVYSLAEQENSVLIKDWFPSTDGDRWRTANIGSQSAMTWQGSNLSTYRSYYNLRTDNSTNAWQRLTNAIYVLNNTPTNVFRTRIEEYFALDRWLWFLATENVFADEDSYVIKGADYSFYYEPESGRYHPIEHDGNEAFQPGDQSLSPVQGSTATDRPLLYRTLRIPELRQRYLAHMRTVLSERYNPDYLTPVIDRLHRLSVAQIALDPKKNFTMAAYSNELRSLKTFVTNRYRFLTNHVELRPVAPLIETVSGPEEPPFPDENPTITATVRAVGTNGVNSVWLYWRDKNYGWFHSTEMFDDGAHGDGAAGDEVFGGTITNYPAGTKVRYYVEARSANPAKAASFSPARAEQVTFDYRVRTSEVSDSPVIINEFMAENRTTLADPQGGFDDWIELYNSSNEPFDLTGCYLSDNPDAPRKWQFPDGTVISPKGYLLIWADEDGLAESGLHASFKLSNNGEQIILIDADGRNNGVLDEVIYGAQGADYSHGRDPQNPAAFKDMLPTPGAANQ